MRHLKEFAAIYNTQEGMTALLFTAGCSTLIASTILLITVIAS